MKSDRLRYEGSLIVISLPSTTNFRVGLAWHHFVCKQKQIHPLPVHVPDLCFVRSELQPQIIREKYDLGNNFIVVFGGNMGKPQQLENVLELAKRCNEHKNVRFLLLGEGVEMDKIARKVVEHNIENIIIRKSIKKEDYQDLISTCDLGLISLHRDFTIPNIPSKILDYLNVGIPVLASIDRCTDFDKVLIEAGAGLFSYAGDHDAFKQNFDTIYTNKTLREEMGRAGHRYFQQYLLPEQAYNTIMEYVK